MNNFMLARGQAGGDGHLTHIDGVRAIAILLVLLFHFDLAGASRGFLGVDVFFVVSGYLVGGLVMRGMDQGNFSLSEFYRRRAARILPALVVVGIAVLSVGCFVMLPMELTRTATGIRAAILMLANKHFYDTQDYFGPDKNELHFLHSWSLSVEEQFYVAFPILIFLIARLKVPRTPALLSMLIASLLLAIWLTSAHRQAAFYFTPVRAWELLAGVALAGLSTDTLARMNLGGRSAVVGLVMAVVPAFVPKNYTAVPALTLQMACVFGVALLIAANVQKPKNPVAALLSLRPMRAVGLISYSLYLVHWPIWTLARAWSIVPMDMLSRFLLMCLSFVLAFLSWRVIEVPARNWANSKSVQRRTVLSLAGLVMVLMVALTSLVIHKQGFPDRLHSKGHQYLAGLQDVSPRRKECHSNEVDSPIPVARACVLGSSIPPSLAVWGDSHGVEISYALGEALRRQNMSLVQMTSSNCPPLLRMPAPFSDSCARRNSAVATQISKFDSVKTVLLTQFYYGDYGDYDFETSTKMEGLARSIDTLQKSGKRVILLGPAPLPAYNVPIGLARRTMASNDSVAQSLSIREHKDRRQKIMDQLTTLARQKKVPIADPEIVMCNAQICPYAIGHTTMYFDSHHPTVSAARRVVPLILKAL
jgi:peptidoglycan/LPS O-acetylase OafA/YrhL